MKLQVVVQKLYTVTKTICFSNYLGTAMTQVDIHHPLNVETQVRTRTSPRVICGGQGGTATGFSQVLWFPLPSVTLHRTHYSVTDITKSLANASLTP